MPQPPQSFLAAASDFGLAFEGDDLDRLARLLELLLETNRTVNLTAIRDPEEAWTRHILDSLTLIPLLADLEDGARVADVGAGGGFPGLPLAVTQPRLRFTLIEATGKKIDWLRNAAAELGLDNVEVLQGRAETIGQQHKTHRESFDIVTARALGPLNVVAELTVPLARIGGVILLIKGARADEEIAHAKEALHRLHARHVGTIDTPTGRVVVLDKPRKTPRDYPRRDGEPKRAPLGGKMP